jgi:DNA polymerase-3 subunit alpha
LHPEFLSVLESTYGVIVYQEQLQALWQRLAAFTSPESQDARKAVAKKWTHKLKPIKTKWLEGAGKSIGEEAAAYWWEKMETFGRYAFNKCLHKDTMLTCQSTEITKTIEDWYRSSQKPVLKSLHDGLMVNDKCVDIHDTGIQEVFEVTFEDGTTERVTARHKFLCADGQYHTVIEIVDKGLDVTSTKSARC